MIFKNRKLHFEAHNRQHNIKGFPNDRKDWGSKNFLTIAPALPVVVSSGSSRKSGPRFGQRSASAVSAIQNGRCPSESSDLDLPPHESVYLQATSDGKVPATRTQNNRDKNSDRICLDRRGLTHLPNFTCEKNVRMLSLQHNLISRIDGFSSLGLGKLVILDLYNNQIENIAGLDSLENLRVLLFGKNRLKRMTGLKSLRKLEVLDLHGNQIGQISGSLTNLADLKVLNLAGNQIRALGDNDLDGLLSLQELNLKRNRLKKITDLTGPVNLEKIFLSNNEISAVDDLTGIPGMPSLKEITIDGNPVSASNECVHFLVSNLPNLEILSHMHVTETLRRSAFLWRKNQENLVKAIATETKPGAPGESSRVEVISNARANWELLRNQTKRLPSSLTSSSLKDLRTIEESDLSVGKTVQSDSVLSVASSITLSSRESVMLTKGCRSNRRNFLSKRSRSEEAADEGLEISDSGPEYFKLPPILASLAGEKSTEKSSANSDSSEKSKGKSNFDINNEITSSEMSEATVDHGTDESELEGSGTENGGSKRAKSASHIQKKTLANKKERCTTSKTKPKFQAPAPGKIREQGGDYLIEICGRCLNVYGQGALRFIDRPWNPVKAGDVTTVRFNYVSFGGICNVLSKLKQRFPNAENFVFRETNITCLGQLNALADVQGLTALQIDEEGNPITEKTWRNYAIYRLAHWGLKKINGVEVTEEDLEEVAREFQGLSDLVLWSLPESLLQPLLTRLRIEGTRSNSQQTAKQWLRNADPALRSVVCKEALQWRRGTQDDLYWRQKGKNHLGSLLDLTCSAVEKLQVFETRWPTILNQMIRETLLDYSHMDSYMKKCIQELL